jgi:hypothetical protein
MPYADYPFHSRQPECKVYHNRTECTEGNNIEDYNLIKGTGGLALCKHCERLADVAAMAAANPMLAFTIKHGLLARGLLGGHISGLGSRYW